MKNIKFKSIIFMLLFLVFSGCGDKNDKKNDKTISSSVKAPKIEIIQNDNVNEIKVEAKKYEKKKPGQAKDYYYDYGEKSAYNQNAQPANKDASVRVRPRTVVEAYAHIRSPYERVKISLIVKQLSPTFRLKCSACHDDYANGVLGPSLLGKKSEYIYKKIIEFKTGVKSNPLMVDLIKTMSDKEIKKIADEIYEFNKQVQKIKG